MQRGKFEDLFTVDPKQTQVPKVSRFFAALGYKVRNRIFFVKLLENFGAPYAPKLFPMRIDWLTTLKLVKIISKKMHNNQKLGA